MTKWIATTQQEAGELLGVGARQVAEYMRRGCPGESGHYPLPEMVAWCKQHVWTRRVVTAGDDPDEDDDSPALERLRSARASIAELELREREGELLRQEHVHTAYAMLGETVRRGMEQVQRDHPEAAEILNENLDDLEREYRDRFGDPDAD